MTNYQGPGRYRHYKGGEYEVLGLALQENTVTKPHQIGEGHEEITFVIYRPLTPGSMLEIRDENFWARELDDFNETVVLDNGETLVPRFERMA